MRLRSIKNSNDIIKNSKMIVTNPEKHIKKWNELFQNLNPIHIEIGMGKGQFIKNNTLSNPNINYIGIEKFDNVMARAIKKLEDDKISNLKLIVLDALRIDEVFSQEIDTIYLNFSDPWPKNKHEKRRLTSFDFLTKYDKIFKNYPNIIFKTDNKNLFEYSLKSLTDYGYKIKEISLDLHDSLIKDIITTEYEDKFITKGCNIYYCSFSKK